MNLKNKLNKPEEQRQDHSYGELFDGCQMAGVWGGMSEEVRELRSTNRSLQNTHGDVKYSVGNGAAKKLICMTPGHEQRCGDCLEGVGDAG